MDDATNGAKVFLGWLLGFLLLYALTRTRTGYTIVYYALWLAVVLLFLGSYQRIDALLSLVKAPEGPSGG